MSATRPLLAATAALLIGAIGLGSAVAAPPTGASVTVGVDASAAGNTANALGAIDGCVSLPAAAGTQALVDIYVDAVPSGVELSGFNYHLEFDDKRLKIVKQDHALLLTTVSSGAPVDLSDSLPAVASPHQVAVANLTQAGPKGPVSGVLGRYTFEVLPNASPGTSLISLSATGNQYIFGPDGAEIPVDQTVAARIAVGQSCTAQNPTPNPISDGSTGDGETPGVGDTPGPDGNGEDGADATPPAGEDTPGASGTPAPDGSPNGDANGEDGDDGETPGSEEGDGDDDDGGGVSTWLIVLAAAGVALVGAGGGYLWWWRRRKP